MPLGALKLSTCHGELPVRLGEFLAHYLGATAPSPAKTLSAKSAKTVSAKSVRKRHAARSRRALDRALEDRSSAVLLRFGGSGT